MNFKSKIVLSIIVLLLGIIGLAADTNPYASRIKPFTSVPGNCAENSVGYSMTLHNLYICTNTGFKNITSAGGIGDFSSIKLDGATSGIITINPANIAGTYSLTLPTNDGASGQYLQTDGSGVLSWQTVTSGITNSAGNNVIPRSDGTNLVASQITDDGIDISMTLSDSVDGTLSMGSVSNNIIIDGSGGGDNVAITGNSFNNTATTTSALTAPLITNVAATSISNITPLWGTGTTGAEFQINTNGRISTYAGNVPLDGNILIGNTTSGIFTRTNLTAGSGISVTNGAGSITIAQDNTGLGTILGIPINNTVLATATGTVYSSPGNDGTALSIATEGNVSFPIPRAGTIRNLFVRTGGTAKTNTPTTVITIRKNGVDTVVTLTMTQTINTTTSDITHNFTVVQGDLITISFTTTGVAGVSTSIAGVSFELD